MPRALMPRFSSLLRRSIPRPTPRVSTIKSGNASIPDRKYGCKVLHSEENATVDIVFVHGLTGDRISTWTTEGVCWPKDLLHEVVSGARTIVFGYDADVANFWSPASQNTIDDHAQALVNSVGILREKDNTNERPLIFIGHSLGGIVIQNALFISWSSVEAYRQKVIKSTRAIIFLGTPHCGASMASWAEFGGNIIGIMKKTNKKILSSLTVGSEVLGGIQDRFHTLLRLLKEQSINITLICFYEELYVSWIGKKVVPDTSSKLNGYVSEGIHANHMEMTRFRDVEDPGFEKVSNQIWLCFQDIAKGIGTMDRGNSHTASNDSNDNRGSNGGVYKSSTDSYKNIVAAEGAFIGQ